MDLTNTNWYMRRTSVRGYVLLVVDPEHPKHPGDSIVSVQMPQAVAEEILRNRQKAAVMDEFVKDIEAVGAIEDEWPDLAVTYEKAVAASEVEPPQ